MHIGEDTASGSTQESPDKLAAALREIEGLRTALINQRMIGQATGILMERFALPADVAIDVLRRLSSHSNVRLHRIAQGIADTRTIPTGSAFDPSSKGQDQTEPPLSIS